MGANGQSITLANSIIGVGILAMPFCFQQCGALLSVLMLLLSSVVSRLACYFLLKSAIMARKRNFEFLAFHVFGSPGKLMVEIAIIGFLMGTCIAYFVVVGDLGPQIVSKIFNINQSNTLRTCIMVLVSLSCVLPLGLLRNVDSLSNVSAATIGFYFCLVIKVMAEATSQLFTGDWWNKAELWKPEGVLQCVPIFSMALFCQTQLFEIFEALPSLSLEKMNIVTKNAINICTVVYLMVGIFGYIAFCGQHISGNILMSLSPTMASDVIKLGFVMSLAFSFPLIIFPCRASIYSLMYRKVLPSHHDHIINHSIPESTFRCITVAIIATSLITSLMIPNIELVLGLVGSTIGVMICVVFPSACFVNVVMKNTNERLLAKVILCLGLIVMVLGTYANLEAADSNTERYDDKNISPERIDKIVRNYLDSENQPIKPIEIQKKKTQYDIKDSLKKDANKNSAAQPPNPVAPDSNSKNEIESKKQIDAVKKLVANNKMERDAGKKSKKNEDSKDDEKKLNDAIKQEEQNHKKAEKIAADLVIKEDKLKILKQQELIETLKQHGEEQKELIKEQKEILGELKKTKEEIEKKKESFVKEEVNKIAVESIKKIANIAIKSLSGPEANEVKAGDLSIGAKNKNSVGVASDVLQMAVKNIEKIVNEVSPKSNEAKHHEDKIQKIKEIDKIMNPGKDKIVQHNLNDSEPNQVANNILKPNHIDSPNEPKSQANKITNQIASDQKLLPSKKEALLSNLPVPLIMSQNFENIPSLLGKHISDKNAEEKLDNAKTSSSPNIKNQANVREKRDIQEETVNTNKVDKQCENLDKPDKSSIDIKVPQKLSVPIVNLENINIEKQHNSIHIIHQSRQLKSIGENKKR